MTLKDQGKNTLRKIIETHYWQTSISGFHISTMAEETPSSAVTRTMIDNWLQTSSEDAAKPEVVYNDILAIFR